MYNYNKFQTKKQEKRKLIFIPVLLSIYQPFNFQTDYSFINEILYVYSKGTILTLSSLESQPRAK